MTLNDTLLREADRCVKCGICLPHCPTYTLTRDEGDSPRGRISLIQGIAGGQLDSPQAHRHLDRCLGCLACQAVCPSGVDYRRLIDGIRSTRQTTRGKRLAHHLITHFPYRIWGRLGLWLYLHTGIRHLLRGFGGRRFRRLDGLLPDQARVGRWSARYPASYPIGEAGQGRIGLFTGCAGRVSDRPALDAAVAVLTRLGFEVVVPVDQGCCGAMHEHSGEARTAEAMAAMNREAFAGKELDAIIYLASGCGAQLVGQTLPAPAFEISQFLNSCPWPDDAVLTPLNRVVGLHTPCTLRHQLNLAEEPEKLLARIPGIQLIRLDQIQCCGAAGSYLLEQPEMADALGDRALGQIREQAPQLLATSNSGCALQLARLVRESGAGIRTVHPIELILLSLKGGTPGSAPLRVDD